jgi:hypothetical protein
VRKRPSRHLSQPAERARVNPRFGRRRRRIRAAAVAGRWRWRREGLSEEVEGRAVLEDSAAAEHQDLVVKSYGREPVRDGEHRAVAPKLALHHGLFTRIAKITHT